MFERKVFQNDNVKIVYQVAGEGQAICLLPSVGRGAEDFHELADLLIEEGFRVILPEPRGLNGSRGPTENITLTDLADDVLNVIQAEGENAFVAGHAFGSIVARACGARNSIVTKGVILIAAGGKNFAPYLHDVINTLADPNSSEEARREALITGFFRNRATVKPSWLVGWSADLIDIQRRARKNSRKEDWWSAGTAPILDLIGENDPFRVPENRFAIQQEFGERVQVQLIKEASHALPEEQPNAVVKAIKAFCVNKQNS